MPNTEALSFLALFILTVALLLTNQVTLATVAIVPFVATSFKYSFPNQKEPSGRNH